MCEEACAACADVCNLRLSLEGVTELLDDLAEGIMCGEIDELGIVSRLEVIRIASRSCLESSIRLDERLADL